ncbi:MAG TPA: reductive dehalogenase [Anaerolineae bacterium]|nr:reductive dehalogenase [Anaerolineae bacterium]
MNAKEKYQSLLVGPIERFDQRNDMFRRARYDPVWRERAKRYYGPAQGQDRAGYTQEDYALRNGAWYVERFFAMGIYGSNLMGLYAWECPDPRRARLPLDARIEVSDPAEVSRKIKRAARFFGASLVGICELDRRWVYSHVSNDITGEHTPLEIPEEYRYAIVMAIEMDYRLIRTSPAGGAAAATGLGYSKMAFVAGLLAQFIRGLGYKAIPCGNDTALSIPIAIEAGLGELGRNGLLITEKFGPRVRLCKVFTDLPLVPDEPYFFGVDDFCRQCMKCAQDCPSRAISFGGKTTEALNISNNPGVLKWPVNGEQCYKYWLANRMDCANCIRVCPFNKEEGWLHDLVRLGVKNAPWLAPLFVWLDGVLGYGRQPDPATIWDG